MPPISKQMRWLTSGAPPAQSGLRARPPTPAALRLPAVTRGPSGSPELRAPATSAASVSAAAAPVEAPAVARCEVANVGLRINGRERSAPWQCLNPATAVQVRRALQLLNRQPGFDAGLQRVPALLAWIWLPTSTRLGTVQRRVAALASALLQDGMYAVGDVSLPVGCIPGIDLHETRDGAIAARLYSEKVDAAGREVIEKFARAMATPLARLAECQEPARVELQLLEVDRVRVRCRMDARAFTRALAPAPSDGPDPRERSRPGDPLRSLGLDSHDPVVAAAHNARLLEALIRAGSALGIDAEPWASEARHYATRWGNCEPLANWRATRRELIGELRLPVHLDRVSVNLSACFAPADAAEKQRWAADVVTQTACIGLASSLACLCTEHSNETVRRARKGVPPARPSPAAREAREPKAPSESGIHSVQYIVGRSLAG
jgi:hypothetical protein